MVARKLWLAAAAAAAIAAHEARAGAAEAASGPQGKQRRTVLHFGEDDIRAGLTRPDGELVQAPRRVQQESLLRVRRSFVDRALAPSAVR